MVPECVWQIIAANYHLHRIDHIIALADRNLVEITTIDDNFPASIWSLVINLDYRINIIIGCDPLERQWQTVTAEECIIHRIGCR